MTAAGALRLALDSGIRLDVAGADLILNAEQEPDPIVLEAVKRHKMGIIALLALCHDAWSAGDWQAFFDERAGISEFDGGFTRPEAEACAFACCISEWMNRNPVYSPSGCCLGCGGDARADNVLLPFGIESTGPAWLHAGCRGTWHASRKTQAVTALTAMGISNRSLPS